MTTPLVKAGLTEARNGDQDVLLVLKVGWLETTVGGWLDQGYLHRGPCHLFPNNRFGSELESVRE